MCKQEFLTRLREGLTGLPAHDVAERLAFYSEMIDDRTEDGLSEEDAVSQIGSVEEIVSQIAAETPLSELVKERIGSRKQRPVWEVVLLVIGSPVWVSLLIAAFAFAFSLYISFWAVIVSLWVADLAFAVGAFAGAAAGVLMLCRGALPQGSLMLGAGLVLAGLSVFLFFGCRAITRGALRLTRKLAVGIKTLFLGKERA